MDGSELQPELQLSDVVSILANAARSACCAHENRPDRRYAIAPLPQTRAPGRRRRPLQRVTEVNLSRSVSNIQRCQPRGGVANIGRL